MHAVTRRFGSAVLAAGMLWSVGCGSTTTEVSESARALGERGEALYAAAAEHQVPEALLVGFGWQLSRLQPPGEQLEAEVQGGHGLEHRHGWMQLTAAQVERAATLLGVDAQQVREELSTNTRAAAALLREEAVARGGESPQWEHWLQAAATLAGLEDPLLAEGFSEDVLATLGDGLVVEFDDGEVLELDPVEGLPLSAHGSSLSAVDQALTAPGEYPPMKWVAAHPNNYVVGRNGGAVKYVIVHMTEGSYYSALSWFAQANPSQASTQYVIKSSNGEITQMVSESHGAWHAGNTHYSQNSIGIEHEGFSSNLSAWFTEAMYQSSAKLVCAIARRHGIPVDSQHIIGHFQVPNPYRISQYSTPATSAQWAANRWNYGGASNHFDPSYGTSAWNWPRYLGLVKSCVDAANGTPTPTDPTTPPGAQNPITCSGSACWPGNDLVEGNTGDRVYSLQTALIYLGFLNGQTAMGGPGIFGPATKAALVAFQRSKGLTANGFYNAATATALGNALKANPPDVPSANLWIGMTHTQVTQLQRLLALVGYDLPATGYYGEMTRTAVRSFQQAHGLADGDGSYGALSRMMLAAHFKGF